MILRNPCLALCLVEIEVPIVKVFFSDLDNTLIYSHRHRLSHDKIVVEYLNGKEQSFMTREIADVLANMDEYEFIPVSTRTEAQYNRLICMNPLHVKYAIICNGGKLLIDGKVDDKWNDESYQIAVTQKDSMEKAVLELTKLCHGREIHRPELYMCYVSVDLPTEISDALSQKINTEQVEIRCDNRKVYLFSKGINKGEAIRRFRERFWLEYAIAAGDNEMDIPMLNEVDYALAADSIFSDVKTKNRMRLVGDDYSSQICEELKSLYDKGAQYD